VANASRSLLFEKVETMNEKGACVIRLLARGSLAEGSAGDNLYPCLPYLESNTIPRPASGSPSPTRSL